MELSSVSVGFLVVRSNVSMRLAKWDWKVLGLPLDTKVIDRGKRPDDDLIVRLCTAGTTGNRVHTSA